MPNWQIALVIMTGYLAVAMAIGILAGRGRNKASVSEFTTAGRGLGLIVMWFLMGGAIFSAFAFLGAPGWAFSMGAPALYILAYTAFAIIPWYILAPKIGAIGRRHGLYSLVGFFYGRYRLKTLSALVGLIAFLSFIQYLATQMTGMAIIFNIMTEGRVPIWLGALAAYGIVVVYVATGGLRAAAWSDVFQGALMIIISWTVGLAIVYQLHGGIGEMFRGIAQENPGFLQIGAEGSNMSPMAYATIILVSVIGFIMWPHLFSKSYVTDARTAKKTVIAYPIFALFVIPLLLAGFAAVGVVGTNQIDDPDTILPYLITTVMDLPGWLYGLVGAGALAAAMSSADAITHSAALEFHDGVVKNARPGMSELATVRMMRALVVFIGALAYLVTVFGGQGLVALLLGAYGSIVQFAPGVYAALYWRRVTPVAIISGLVVGVIANYLFQFSVLSAPFEINAGIAGLLANVLVVVALTYLTRPQDERVVAEYVDATDSEEYVSEEREPEMAHR
ncbi:MAG: sodium:solute symporter family protein [Rubrobacter sp.]|nr:sodium:solute symporter family protein [Rubrobacter sp.]